MATPETVTKHFPNAIPEAEFVKRTLSALEPHGFTATNAIGCVSVCRDELSRSMHEHVAATYGHSFNFSGLAGMLFAGNTGYGAAHAHSPNGDGRERYVYVAMPHIGVNAEGVLGKCTRQGRSGGSSACGALVAFKGELDGGKVSTALDPNDLEQTVLKARVLPRIPWGEKPEILELTRIVSAVIADDLACMVEGLDKDKADVAVFCGIQVHDPDNNNHVVCDTAYCVVKGERHELKL